MGSASRLDGARGQPKKAANLRMRGVVSMARARQRKDNERVCILQGQQTPAECHFVAGRCNSRSHSHTTMTTARGMLEDGLAHWEQNCLKLDRPRRWKPRMSRDPMGAVMVWQLVS